MAGVNKAIIVGHLGADPEVRFAKSGKAVANMRIATSEKRGGEEVTEWHRATAFDKTAELCGEYLKKGRMVCVEGRLQTRKWQDKDGRDCFITEILADRVHFLGGGERDNRSRSDNPGPDDEDIAF